MAKLPSREDLGALPSARTGRAIASADGSAVGRGMAEFGTTVAKIGDRMYDRALAAQEYETEAKFQEFKWNQERDAEEQMRAVEPGQAAGFADRWASGYQEKAKEFLAGVPNEFKQKYDAKLFGVERHLH